MGLLYCITIPAGIGLATISGGLRAGKKYRKSVGSAYLSDRFPPVDPRQPSIGTQRGDARRVTAISANR
jgi:hypothetical protein